MRVVFGIVFIRAWADEIHFVPTVNRLSVFYNHAAVGTLCRVSAVCVVKTIVSFAGWKPNGSPAWGNAPGAQHTLKKRSVGAKVKSCSFRALKFFCFLPGALPQAGNLFPLQGKICVLFPCGGLFHWFYH